MRIAIGSLFGGIVAGALVAGLGSWLYVRQRRRSAPSREFLLARNAALSPQHSHNLTDLDLNDSTLPLLPLRPLRSYRSMNSGLVLARNLPYEIEPFTLSPTSPSDEQVPHPTPTTNAPHPTPTTNAPPPTPISPLSPGAGSAGTEADGSEARRQHVYVVHHDGGGPPVSVYTADGAQVTELPPSYAANRPSGPRQRSQRGRGETAIKPRRGHTAQPSSG